MKALDLLRTSDPEVDYSSRPDSGAATSDDGHASMRSKGGTQSNGTRGPAGFEDEYS